ncbi:MAG TPA: Ig-like domain-containing protein, partial [Symbiobacteriaceae bacterium]|nr:Ig-like domain-containing protein [Symbiobacteriaceae bacterium]
MARKIIGLLLALAMLVSPFTPALAGAATTAALSFSASRLTEGDLVTLSVHVSGVRDLFAATVDIDLDDEILLSIGDQEARAVAIPGDWFKQGLSEDQYGIYTYVVPTGLRVVVTLLGNAAPLRSGSGTLVEIPLQVMKPGTKALDLTSSVQLELATRGSYGVAASKLAFTPAGEPASLEALPLQAPALTAPASGQHTYTKRPVLQGTANPGWTVKLAGVPGLPATVTAGADGRWSATATADIPNGTYQLQLSQKHPVTGVESTPAQVDVVIDAIAPQLDLTVMPSHIRQGDVTVTLTGSEALDPATVAGTYLAPGATQASDLTFTANAAKTVFTATVAVDPTGLEAAD